MESYGRVFKVYKVFHSNPYVRKQTYDAFVLHDVLNRIDWTIYEPDSTERSVRQKLISRQLRSFNFPSEKIVERTKQVLSLLWKCGHRLNVFL